MPIKKFFSVNDVTDINALLQKAILYKQEPLRDRHLGNGKNIALLFFNPSLRTRLSTQIAAQNLGLQVLNLNIDKDSWQIEFNDNVIMNGNSVEHIKEAAGVIGSYVDIIGIRSFPLLHNYEEDKKDFILNQFYKYAGVPIISLEGTTLHPLQSFADIITIYDTWKKPHKPKIVMTWAPHIKALPQAVPNSFVQWIMQWKKTDFIVTHPEGYELDKNITGEHHIEYNQKKALEGADYVYVKNWSSTKIMVKSLAQMYRGWWIKIK